MKNDKIDNKLEKALKIIGKKYDLLIIESINNLDGRARFNEISNNITSINPRILSIRLKELEKNKLITKNLILGDPVKIEYALSSKAKTLIPIINQIKKWSE